MALRDVLVCLKWVPTRTEIDPISGEVKTDPRFSGLSPADESALEWAFRIAGSLGGSVTAVTVGPPQAEKALTDALACGAVKAIRFDAPTSISSATCATALASVSRDFQMVVCGDYSLDRGSGSVPAFVAHQLQRSQALGLISVEVNGDHFVGTRRLDQGRREKIKLAVPGVISFEAGAELRRAALSSTLSASTIELDVRPMPPTPNLAEPALIAQSAFKPRTRVVPAPSGDVASRVAEIAQLGSQPAQVQAIKADPDSAADATIAQLKEWGYL